MITAFIGMATLKRLGFTKMKRIPGRINPSPGYSVLGAYDAQKDGKDVRIVVLQKRFRPGKLTVHEMTSPSAPFDSDPGGSH